MIDACRTYANKNWHPYKSFGPGSGRSPHVRQWCLLFERLPVSSSQSVLLVMKLVQHGLDSAHLKFKICLDHNDLECLNCTITS